MSQEEHQSLAQGEDASGDDYVVIARRYRPQIFADLIGQQHIAAALEAAIATNRVGHAYLFTGARGVGKTSAARIFASALNAPQDDADLAEIREAIFRGEDLDVLEIDGASNRGIDDIRELRSNVNIRPSRSRFKIYIIDEVHMLTRDAFNALLKTLEEPPKHVKFIFCTTEPNKIPITVLSRCQRFDFAGIESESIVTRLRQIAEAEGADIDDDAIQLLARRADGSMRDGQSLLEQLIAFTSERIFATTVHHMLGTAESTRLLTMARRFSTHDAAGLLEDLDTAIHEGVDVGNLLEQLLGIFRDCMMAQAGCGSETFISTATGDEAEKVKDIANQLGMEPVLAILQILQQALGNMRFSTQRRSIAEVALVRGAQLEGLEQLSTLIARLEGAPSDCSQGSTAAAARSPKESGAKKKSAEGSLLAAVKNQSQHPPKSAPVAGGEADTAVPPAAAEEPSVDEPNSASKEGTLTAANAQEIWTDALTKVSDSIRANAGKSESIVASAENALTVTFAESCSFSKSLCERPDNARKIENAVSEVAGTRVRLTFTISSQSSGETPRNERPVSRKEKLSTVAENPMVKQAQKLFGARPTTIH